MPAYNLGRSTKTHLYWCMKNAGGDPTELRRLIMNISQHYQVMTCLHVRTSLHHCRLFYLCMHIHVHVSCLTISQGKHVGCCDSSPCQHPNYSPSKIVLNDSTAIEAYEKALQQTQIYRYAESYCRVPFHECAWHMYIVHVPTCIHMVLCISKYAFGFSVQRHLLG